MKRFRLSTVNSINAVPEAQHDHERFGEVAHSISTGPEKLDRERFEVCWGWGVGFLASSMSRVVPPFSGPCAQAAGLLSYRVCVVVVLGGFATRCAASVSSTGATPLAVLPRSRCKRRSLS